MCGCIQSSESTSSEKHVTLTNRSPEACTELNQDDPQFSIQWLQMCDSEIIGAERTRLVTKPWCSEGLVMILQLESSDMFYEKKVGKECATVTEEGRWGAQIGHKKKTHSFERTHVLDSTVTLTHPKRNDAGWERREGRRKSKKRSEGKEKNTFSQVESDISSFLLTVAPLILHIVVYKQQQLYKYEL